MAKKKALEINRQKSLTLENFIRKYGEKRWPNKMGVILYK